MGSTGLVGVGEMTGWKLRRRVEILRRGVKFLAGVVDKVGVKSRGNLREEGRKFEGF